MKPVAKFFLFASAAVTALTLGLGTASAQGWGPVINSKEVDPVVRATADVMGMIRTRNLVIGQVNLPEFVGKGTMVDLEAATPGAAVEVSRYTYAVSIHTPASRLDYEGPKAPRTIRVVKGAKAWNEAWSADKKKLSTSPADATAAYRAQMVWLQPHAFIHAASYAGAKKCLDGKACTPEIKIGQEGGKTVIELPINGTTYKGTMGADKRPARIEATIKLPSGAAKKIVATFSGWRTGEKEDAGFGTAYGTGALDRFHSGTYWPSRLTHEMDGTKVLDLTISEGWANPYTIFPEPELLAKAQ